MDYNTKVMLEEMLREYEYMRSILTTRIERLHAMLGTHAGSAVAAPAVIPPPPSSDMGNQIRDTIERKRQEIMVQAEEVRQNAMRQAQEGVAAANRPGVGMSPGMGMGMGMGMMSGMGGMMPGMFPGTPAAPPIRKPKGEPDDGKR